MSSLYQIDTAILNCCDIETGEIIDADALDALMMEREQKIENIALYIKNLTADAAAYKAEKEAFAAREAQAANKAANLKKYLTAALNGQKFSTPRCAVSFRRSEMVEIDEEGAIPAEYMTETVKRTPDKVAIKAAIKAGQEISGCHLVENQIISIK